MSAAEFFIGGRAFRNGLSRKSDRWRVMAIILAALKRVLTLRGGEHDRPI
jgi:hypothetical protein